MTPAPNKAVAKQRATSSIPEGAKKPSDHQPAKEDVTGPQDTTVWWPPVSEDGDVSHEYLIEGEALDDAELLEFFTDENFVGALRIMLGPKQWRDYKDVSRLKSGRVTASGAAEFLNHILAEVKRGNS